MKSNEKTDSYKEIKILFEDQYLIVIEKPAGLLSVSYPGNSAKTVIDILETMMRKSGSYSPLHKPFPVHRLDRETSGVLMFALSKTSQKKIMDSWHTMVKERLYRAVAENPFSKNKLPDSGLINDALASNAYNLSYVPLKSENGKKTVKTVPARTYYKVIERGKTHTLFELSLDTGKKNQIRAHLASKKYVLAGDYSYHAKTDPFGRLALHARSLDFVHPYTNEKMHFEVPEPSDWIDFVQKNKTGTMFFSKDKKNYAKNPHGTKFEKHVSGKKASKLDFIQKGKLMGKKHR